MYVLVYSYRLSAAAHPVGCETTLKAPLRIGLSGVGSMAGCVGAVILFCPVLQQPSSRVRRAPTVDGPANEVVDLEVSAEGARRGQKAKGKYFLYLSFDRPHDTRKQIWQIEEIWTRLRISE